ncbi:hypothetical protein EVAR_37946_1 [Eumeta japonica]|uniref:Integrase zinc-binding domain-containing protein n=2 Tax=Eumeta variegata TaxID=151549 RepID=A0A4C1XG33_EUMVA|nr:hypothetical protein EVAR_37946_1 [Eumeta japonica]
MCKLITIKCDESEARGARGVGPLIGRAVRDARAREGGRARRTALLYASAARHSQSAFNRRRGNTLYPSSETKFWSALRPPSKTRLRECNTAEESTIADLASVVRRARISSTVRRRTVNPDAPAALIPMSGGVTIDHSASERVPTTSPVPPARAVSRAASVSSRSTQASRAAARLRMEYEAAEELAAIQKQDAEIRRELVKKRLAMNLAEIEAATECDEAEEHAVHRTEDSARRVEAWIESTPPVVNVINAAANQAGIPRREGVADDAARTTLPDRVQPGSVARREHSSERGPGPAELADAINKLARPRPIPRQVYELPSFHGNVNEWRLFKNSYEATTSTYEYKPYENLARLRMAVQGKARTAVCHLLAANSKPEDIMAALEKKFGRPEQLVDEVLKEVKVMSRLTDSGREINDFAITTRNCVAVLQEIDEEGHIHNPVLLKEILEKMTPLLRNKFAEYWMMKREEGRREAKLIVLADFLEREAELAAVYARAAAAPQLSASAPGRIAERAPRRREAFKVNTQTEVTASVRHGRRATRAGGAPNESAVSETVTNIGTGESKALLKIVPVTIRAADREIKVHALLDDGATVTLLDDSVASHINAKGPRAELKLISARGHQISDRNSRRIKIKVRGPNGVERDIQCRTITRLDLPSQSLTADEISSHHHLNECHLEALRDARPLLLIGQDNWELITGSDVRRGKSGEPVASLTGLGWVVHGRRGRTTTNDGMIHCLADLELAVREHFEIESLGITQRERENAEVKRASRILNDTTRRIGNKWETGLLWKEDDPRFPDNYNGARKRLTNIENKMDRDPAFAAAYTAQIEKLIENGYARRFRIGSVAFTGDIRDMFLRVRVCAPDQRAQLFLWRGADRDSEPRVYAMTSLIFGASSSPTSAIYVLNKNAETCSDEYPNAEMAVKRDHYVDDFICSTDSVPEAAKLISDVTIVHARGGFDIRGWATNAPELKESLSAESSAEAATVSLHKTKTERALGLIWEPECDSLGFDVTFKKLPRWDDVLLERDYAKWVDYLDEVRKLSQLRIPRCYALRSSKIELHVFGDASEHAYAAVAYWRAVRPDGTVHLALVAGKSRVAPNKVMSIPRLELQAALLACRLATNIQRSTGSRQNVGCYGATQRQSCDGSDRTRGHISHGRDHAVRLLVEHYHRRAGHANHEAVVNIIRERFWITRLRPTVKKVANACRLCRVRRAQPVTPKMADLPGGASPSSKAIYAHRVDYFGPLEVTVGRRREKRWAALFTCLTTRAVHMEVASSLSADSMIMALRRFMARRGQPDTLYSDHGTNFVGAAAELSRARLEIEERMSDEATTRAIRWLRIPTRAEAGNAWSGP